MAKTSRERSNSKGKDKLRIHWDSYLLYIHELSNDIQRSKIKFDFIFGIPRGGLIPAVILSHSLNKRMIYSLNSLGFKLFDPKKVLVVDDIIDSGKTLGKLIKKGYHTATIFKHHKCKIKPEFNVFETDKWIQFPYERD